MTKNYRPPTWIKMLGLAAALAVTPFTNLQAATINMSSIETALSDPDDHDGMQVAMWVGFMTQIYEYNMPFIELSLDDDEAVLSEFRMTIGDTDYNFSNEFLNHHQTNARTIPVTGAYALAGLSTPDASFTTSLEDGGDTLVLNFGPGGLQPGETVRFQVDINADPGSVGTMMFQNYAYVFFTANGGDDTSGNSMITLDYATGEDASVTLPNYMMDEDNFASIGNPRPHSDMQGITILPDLEIGIPEPTSAGLVLVAGVLGLAVRRRFPS